MREKGGSFAVPFKDFSDFFFRATSHRPYPYQRHLAGQWLEITHWADGSSRNDFKLYAGNRSAAGIARAMLLGTREKPGKGQ